MWCPPGSVLSDFSASAFENLMSCFQVCVLLYHAGLGMRMLCLCLSHPISGLFAGVSWSHFLSPGFRPAEFCLSPNGSEHHCGFTGTKPWPLHCENNFWFQVFFPFYSDLRIWHLGLAHITTVQLIRIEIGRDDWSNLDGLGQCLSGSVRADWARCVLWKVSRL